MRVTHSRRIRAVGRGGLVVSDIEAAHDELARRGIETTDVCHVEPEQAGTDLPT
jgi:hypothetical protein